jgi:hypothetical protein
MANVSAEARGLVRVALSEITVAPGDGLAQRFSAALEARVARLTQGKRLTEKQVEAIKRALDALTPHRTEVGGWRVYCQGRKLILDGPEPFTELLLEVRAMRLECTRRRVRYDDHPLGLQISFHALARLIERTGKREDLIQSVVAAATETAAFFAALRLGHGADCTFAIPFADGLAFGEYTNQDQLLGTMVYEADDEGSGFTTMDGPTSMQLSGGPRIGARIASYLSSDQLNPRQDALLRTWRELEAKYVGVWPELMEITLGNKATVSNALTVRSLGLDVRALATSDLWGSTIRPSRPALALAASAQRSEEP